MSNQFTVVELAEIQIVGLRIQTDMKKAEEDCPALWQSFGPRICGELSESASLSKLGDSYGVSKMIDENNFMYWATVGVSSIDSLPEGMETMTIPKGLYVKCTVPSLAQLGECIMAIYTEWPATQNEYKLDMHGISVERYPENWQFTEALEVYASVIKK